MEVVRILEVVTIVLAGLLVGNELAVAAFVHPTIARLGDTAHKAAAVPIAKLLGRVMPIWYTLVLLLIVAVAWTTRDQGRSILPLVVAAALWVGTIVFTVVALVPINTRVAGWTEDSFPVNWREDRARWDGMHRIRVLVLIIALVCLVAGLV